MIGKVEKVEFTRNAFGNQFTTIDGVRYWTWWDICKVAVREGVTVEHEPYQSSLHLNGNEIPYQGTTIRAIVEQKETT